MEEMLLRLINMAINKHASDIHFQVLKHQLRIELRTSQGIKTVSQDIWKPAFFEFLKFYAQLDLTNPYIPQSGHFSIRIDDTCYYCRLSVIVNKGFQTGVIRIMNTNPSLTIHSLTTNREHIKQFQQLCTIRQGLVLAVGPTNTGKTTTLHAILHEIAHQHKFKVVSLEDPIEIEDTSYIQLQINEPQGFTYEKGIEELLRHDPDVIFIGETRSEYTAHMVVRAALTGHLVFTTLHAKNGIEAIQRLRDFGLSTYDLQNTLTTIISQRLYATDAHGGKECIYEILSKKDIEFVLQKNTYPSESFHSLAYEIKEAIKHGTIHDPQAEYDLQNL